MSPRLPRDARRAQLLGVAHDILKREGSDALTLARLAERAGVSKPVAYDHFTTRAGLLAALFASFDARQVEQMTAAMATSGTSLRAASEVAAAGYLHCLVGPEYEDLCAALLAYDETKDVLRGSRAAFAEAYRDVFATFVTFEGTAGRAILSGLVGAAEALAREMHDGTLAEQAAIDALGSILLATLQPLAPSHQGAGPAPSTSKGSS